MKGYIKIDRSFFESDEWKTPRRYSRAEALLDIQRRAMVYDTEGMAKGEVVLHKRETAKAWGWGDTSVLRFLRKLEREGRLHRTERPEIYSLTPRTNKRTTKRTTLNADNQHIYEDERTTKRTTKRTDLPFFIKDKKEKCARAREAEAVAHGAEKKSRFDSFRAWAADNIPAMADTIDLSIWQMMLGQAYGDAVKMAKVLKAMEADGVGGTPNALLKEYERRCPR